MATRCGGRREPGRAGATPMCSGRAAVVQAEGKTPFGERESRRPVRQRTPGMPPRSLRPRARRGSRQPVVAPLSWAGHASLQSPVGLTTLLPKRPRPASRVPRRSLESAFGGLEQIPLPC